MGFLGRLLLGFLPMDHLQFGKALIVVFPMAQLTHFAHGHCCFSLPSLAFLMNLVVRGRSRLVYGRERTNDLRRRGLHSRDRELRVHETSGVTAESRCITGEGVT